MDEKTSIIVRGKECKERLLYVINFIADIVKLTLGPGGKNVMYQQDWRGQRITNDGVRIAKQITFEDEVDHQIKEKVVEIADETNKQAGDGTTTSITLAQAIVTEIEKSNDSRAIGVGNKNVMDIRKEILAARDKVFEEIKKRATPVKTEKQLIDVAITSLENKELGEMIAKMVWKIGVDGYVDVVEGFNKEIETDSVVGMKFDGRYVDARLSTDKEHRRAIYLNSPILVTNHKIDEKQVREDIERIASDLVQSGNHTLVLVAENYETKARLQLLGNTLSVMAGKVPNGIKILIIKAPSMWTEQFEDLAIYTGATFIDKGQNMHLKDVSVDDLGKAEKVVVDEDETIVMGGGGKNSDVEKRKKQIKEEIKAEKVVQFRGAMKKRLANMASGIGIIRVGANTEAELRYLKDKVEDAQFACKSALEEGIVTGGGVILKEIAESLDENILTEALKAPFNQIQKNAGKKVTVSKNIVDPAKVTRCALLNATDVASMLLTVDVIIAEKKDRTQYEGLHQIADALEESNRNYRRKQGWQEFEKDKPEVDKKRLREQKDMG